jgi:hypothetical protein
VTGRRAPVKPCLSQGEKGKLVTDQWYTLQGPSLGLYGVEKDFVTDSCNPRAPSHVGINSPDDGKHLLLERLRKQRLVAYRPLHSEHVVLQKIGDLV